MPTNIIDGIMADIARKKTTPGRIAEMRRLANSREEVLKKDAEREQARVRRTCTPSDQALLKRIVDARGTDAWLAKKILEKGEQITEADRRFIEERK